MGTLLTYTNMYIHIPSLLCCEEHNIHWLYLSRQKTHSSALHYTAKISFHLGFCLQPNRLSKRKAQVLSFHFDLQDCIIDTVYKQLASFSQDKIAKGAYLIITADRGSPGHIQYTHNDTYRSRGATAGKAPKAWALPRFWFSIRSYKKKPVKTSLKIGCDHKHMTSSLFLFNFFHLF